MRSMAVDKFELPFLAAATPGGAGVNETSTAMEEEKEGFQGPMEIDP